MSVSAELRNQIMAQAQGALSLHVAYIGIANGLFSALEAMGQATPAELAAQAGRDSSYVERWCDAAFAFDLLDDRDGSMTLTELGRAFLPEAPGTAMPFAVRTVMSAHLAERAATLMPSGAQPGESVLAERESIIALFGPMFEKTSSVMFEQDILPNVPVYDEIGTRGSLAIDLGCGNGWYLRKIAARFPKMRCIGLDGFADNIDQATTLTQEAGLGERVTFMVGDIHHFTVSEPCDLIAMNRALHHVWNDRTEVFRSFHAHLKSGGAVVIWEPNWPKTRADLRHPSRRGLALQNLSEHVQGNHLLQPDAIEAEFHRVGMSTQVYLFANGNEAVIVGRKA